MCDKDTCNDASCCGECEPWNCLEQQINDALATKEGQLQGYVDETKDAAAESKASAEASAQSAQSAAESKEFRDEAETAASTAVAAESVVIGVANTLQDTADKLGQVADELGTAIAGIAVSSWFYTTVSENQTVIPVPADKNAVDVQSIYIEGTRQSPFRGFEFDKTNMTITLAEPLPLGLEIEIVLGTYNSDNPNDFAHTLASNNGASLVGTTSGNTVQVELDSLEAAIPASVTAFKNQLFVKSIKDLMVLALKDVPVQVSSYVPGTEFGGGLFQWDSTKPKSQHNGITIFSPTVPWDGAYNSIPAFIRKTGETAPAGTGCWVRSNTGKKLLASWGGLDISGVNIMDDIMLELCKYAHNTRRILDMDTNAEVQAGFTKGTQTVDKHNVFTQASVVLDNLYVTIRGNGCKINTYHPVHKERTVFLLRGGAFNISGFRWNIDFTDYSIQPTDTEHRQGEWWMGIVAEGCEAVVCENHEVNACQMFVRADVFNGTTWNRRVAVNNNNFKYVTNYCFLSRKLEFFEANNNVVWYNGREWHTYGEAFAPTTYTSNVSCRGNQFHQQIAEQSCITPGSYVKTCLIANNLCERARGIFVEIGSASNISILNNQSYSTGERDSSHILLVSGGVDDEPAGGLSNLLINGNVFNGGPYTMREYNTGIPIRRGITFSDNHIIDCPAPIMTNQSYIAMRFVNNYVQVPDDFPDLNWAGQYPVIEGNIFQGVRIRSRDLGYTIISPKIRNNIFRANGVSSVFPALVDYTHASGITAEGNDTSAASYTNFITLPANCTTIGFKRLGVTEGLNDSPITLYGSKLTCALGDIIHNREPSATNNKYAWICIDGTAKTFGSLSVAI